MKNRILLLALIVPAFAACSSDASTPAASSPAVSSPVVTEASTTPSAADPTTTLAAAPSGTDSASTDAGGTTAPAAAAAAGAVGIADFKFDPPTINVPVGGSVTWTNNDPQAHTATSAGNFDAGAMQPGGTATVEFKTAGTFTYICSFHPFMNGTVVVG